MTREELKAILTAAGDPNTSAEALVTISDKVGGMITEADDLREKLSDAERTIASLRDTNMRLFLRTTGAGECDSDEPKKIGDMTRAELDAHYKSLWDGLEDTNGN